ncbi:hypothetical protein, partial [Klebsiella aerogenes]|uniref:hypothetical protein n=1 Tax=Klebsiella aerogenes TaxID=548 RepID=UPI0019532636
AWGPGIRAQHLPEISPTGAVSPPRPTLRLLSAACLILLAAPALGASFEFVPAPQIDLNRVYRVDKVTGEVTSCQYG